MSQQQRPPITTHILDTERGKPASGVAITLLKYDQEQWHTISSGVTNSDGRVEEWVQPFVFAGGIYQLQFATAEYFTRIGVSSFYPQVSISFTVQNLEQHYHVPLLLSAYGYTTYRGS